MIKNAVKNAVKDSSKNTSKDSPENTSLLSAGAALLGSVLLAGTLTSSATAQESGADGAALFASCIACHGADAGGNPALGAPALAGQLEVYLKRQLGMFRRDIRGSAEGDTYGMQMQLFAKQLPDDAAVAAVSSYLASLPLVPAAPSAGSGDAGRGESLFTGNCGTCHGTTGEGNEALKAPRLAGLDRAYLERQFNHFRDGVRGANPRDRLGKQMALMASTLPDDQALADVLAYLATVDVAAKGDD